MNSSPDIRSVCATLALVLLLAAGCTTLPPVIRGPENTQLPATIPSPATASAPANATEPTAEAPADTPVPGASEMMSDRMLTPTPIPTPAMTVITGQVTYRQRIALQPDAIVEVELQDVSRADAPATVIGQQRIETQGKQVPIPFAVEYDLSSINPAALYTLRARIIEGGLVTWLTADAPRVITRGAPTDQVDIVVQPSNNPQPVAAPTARLDGVVTYLQRIALPPNAVVEVKLEDISRADAPATLIASQTIETQGKQVPIPYSLEYDPSTIDPRMTYAVSARITEDGKLTWISTTVHPVLTRGAPTNGVEIVVQRVGSS